MRHAAEPFPRTTDCGPVTEPDIIRNMLSRALTLTVSLTLALATFVGFTRPVAQARYDVIIRGGTLYDGTGAAGRRADVAIRGDRIAGVGDFASAAATTVIDATGLAVAPGFINMLSWATESLLVDGRSQGDIRQGVTLEIFGEGNSMGPLNDDMKKRMVEQMGDIKFDITWTTLSEYLRELERRGVSTNVASYLGATTVREHVIGLEDKKPTPQQLDAMRAIVRKEMEAGALGIGSSLDLCAGVLRLDRRAHRAVQGCRKLSRQVHLAHAQRGQSTAGSGGGTDSYQPRGKDSG